MIVSYEVPPLDTSLPVAWRDRVDEITSARASLARNQDRDEDKDGYQGLLLNHISAYGSLALHSTKRHHAHR